MPRLLFARRRWPARAALGAFALALLAVAGCASTTTVEMTPSPQAPVCQGSAMARVFWAPRWRADQKDIPEREKTADEGIVRFFARSGCFASASVARLAPSPDGNLRPPEDVAGARADKTIMLVVRELGPVLAVGSSVALVEGGTEVVLEISEYSGGRTPVRQFRLRWRDGGPGVVKGVASLPDDLYRALAAGMMPRSP